MKNNYASHLMTASERGYTKHYFAEGERLLSNAGGGGYPIIEPREELKPILGDPEVLSKDYTKFAENYFIKANDTSCEKNGIELPAETGNIPPLWDIYAHALNPNSALKIRNM